MVKSKMVKKWHGPKSDMVNKFDGQKVTWLKRDMVKCDMVKSDRVKKWHGKKMTSAKNNILTMIKKLHAQKITWTKNYIKWHYQMTSSNYVIKWHCQMMSSNDKDLPSGSRIKDHWLTWHNNRTGFYQFNWSC